MNELEIIILERNNECNIFKTITKTRYLEIYNKIKENNKTPHQNDFINIGKVHNETTLINTINGGWNIYTRNYVNNNFTLVKIVKSDIKSDIKTESNNTKLDNLLFLPIYE